MDTGYAGSIGSTNLDRILGKSFFASHDLLPRGIMREGLHSWPAPDYTFVGAGAITRSKTWLKGTTGGCTGWNFGADKTRALFIVAGVHTQPFRQMIAIHDAEPTDSDMAGAKSFGFRTEQFGFVMDIGSMPSSIGWGGTFGWTSLLTLSTAFQPTNYRPESMALYVDTAGAGDVRVFIRRHQHGGQWIEVGNVVSAHLSKVRAASWFFNPQEPDNSILAPMGIYAD